MPSLRRGVQQRRSQHGSEERPRRVGRPQAVQLGTSRARYVECRLARVGVCELAIMREMSKRFYPKNVHQPWPLALNAFPHVGVKEMDEIEPP